MPLCAATAILLSCQSQPTWLTLSVVAPASQRRSAQTRCWVGVRRQAGREGGRDGGENGFCEGYKHEDGEPGNEVRGEKKEQWPATLDLSAG